MDTPPLYLKKGEDRRLRSGHLWIFSNEVDSAKTPLSDFAPGEAVTVRDHRGAALGSAYVNPHALICARLFSRHPSRELDEDLLAARLGRALSLRETLFAKPYYRLAFSEGDGLPGAVIDRYGEALVVQITTAGMERRRAALLTAVEELLRPGAVVLRNDTGARQLEGLSHGVGVVAGRLPEELMIEENGARFLVDVLTGQKTGWFYDHRANRRRMRHYVRRRTVLDAFSYTGAWGITAATAGAARVTCLDSSAAALGRVRDNAVLNNVRARVETLAGDVFETLKALDEQGRRFDVILLDPPALIKRRRDVGAGTRAYQRLNQSALKLLTEEGILISSSCSYHLPAASLQAATVKASRALGRSLQLLERGQQSPDHPVHPAMPETDYLKTLFVRPMKGL